ncbi:MAG: hypothetical protein JJT96_13095 [Opitutales bacterium]|nr:hypothetical protein [Opitutales bacterium]
MLYTNIIHRVDARADSREAMTFQWQAARRLSIPTTTLLTYPALFMDEAIADVEKLRGEADELGLHFHNLQSPRFLERFGTRESAFWLLPQKIRIALLDEMMTAFERRFGHLPKSVGGYIIDAWTLAHIKKTYPTVETAITSCFEEGVKMFYGNNRNWFLFSDGGPWNPYFPSRANALVPAADAEEAIDIVAMPHLNRDMIMALNSRDDLFASHPGNLFRARINEGAECPYLFRFIEAWERQAALNGWSYLNIFVSSPWMSANHWAIGNIDDARTLYTRMLEDLKAREERGTNANTTMDAFGTVFRNRVRPGDATLCHWKDEIKQSKREVVWVVNSHHRCAFDMNRGGALVDFRPYAGRLDGNLGPECPALWNGNYPFLISTEHCGGHWNTAQYASLSNGIHSFTTTDRRTRATVEQTGENAWTFRTETLRIKLGEHTLVLQSTWEVSAGAGIRIRRTVLEYDGDPAALRLTETFLGRPGLHEYPGDLREITLHAAPGTRLPFTYSSEAKKIPDPHAVGADIPSLGLHVALEALTPATEGLLGDGWLFKPCFQLALTYAPKPGEDIITCLTTRPLKNP